MQSILTSVSNCKWANKDRTAIDCEITTSQFGDEVLSFTAYKYDVELHGRIVFAEIESGIYGQILPFIDLSN